MSDEYEVEINGGQEPEPIDEAVEQPNQDDQPEETPEEETPSEPPKEEPSEPQLYELPDGRKATPEEVLEEYKKLQSDYTRKSQELSNYKKPGEPKEYQKEDFEPKSYAELIEIAKQAALEEIEQKSLAEKEREQQLEQEIESKLSEIKKVDPNLDENKLFAHAAKWGFRDLSLAHQNMKEMNNVIESTKKQTIESIQKRSKDPVAGKQKQVATEPSDDYYEGGYTNRSLVDVLREIKN